MRVAGLIVEYNPFHNGHLWHLSEAMRLSGADYSVAVMSGNFVQRGEPAFLDKWTRAEMAVRAGVDLVIELPFVFAVRSAQYFAAGAIRLLARLGLVNCVCFGAEHAELDLLVEAAAALDRQDVQAAVRVKLKSGGTYAAALSSVLANNSALTDAMLASPNNILAIEYLRAIRAYCPTMQPIVIKRRAAGYNEQTITGTIASATAIRQAVNSEQAVGSAVSMAVPASTATIIKECLRCGKGPVNLDNFAAILLAKLRLASAADLEKISDIGEGLHYKLQAAALHATCLSELITLLKSKRYTRTRLQRILIHALLGTTKEAIAAFDAAGPLYARVLAFNDNGRVLLKALAATASIPVVNKTTAVLNSKERAASSLTPMQQMLSYDTAASDIYALGMPNAIYHAGGKDFSQSPCYLHQTQPRKL